MAEDVEQRTVATAEAEPGEQMVLFGDGAELVTLEEDVRRGRFSGAIVDKQVAKVKAICGALAEGHGILRVAKAFGVSPHTVMGIRDRHPELIAMEKQQLSRTYGKILAVGAERLLEGMVTGQLSAAQISVPLGIVADKKALLDGEPTVIVAEQRKVPTMEDLDRMIAALPRAKVASDSESVGTGGNHVD